MVLTPAKDKVTTEVAVLREHNEYQKVIEVQALCKYPEVVGSHTVLHYHFGYTAAR